MKISTDKPPIWEEANKFFKLEELGLGSIFTYGDTIYNPFNVELTQDLIVHEMVHIRQQESDNTVAGIWWKRFFMDPDFRLEQELEAYAAQYKYICTQVTDREKRSKNLLTLAGLLSGPMYGHIIGKMEAYAQIKHRALTVKSVV